jgi:hypothetical protein
MVVYDGKVQFLPVVKGWNDVVARKCWFDIDDRRKIRR